MTSVLLKRPLATLPLLLSSLLASAVSHAASYEMRARMPKLVVTAPSGGASSVGGGTSAGATPLAPLLKISTYSEDLGLVSVGTTGTTGLITITNAGTADLSFANSLSVTGVGYSVSSNCGMPLSPGASCVATVSFTPLTPGVTRGTLSVSTSAGVQTVSLSGTGSGPVLGASASQLAFGDVNVGDTTQVLGVQFNNTGTEGAAVSGVNVTGADASLFGASTTCAGTLAASGSCLTNVSFTPSSAGARTAALNLNASSTSISVSLTGTGKALTPGGVLIASAASGGLTLTTASTTSLAGPASVVLTSGANAVAASTAVSWDSSSRTLTANMGALPPAGAYVANVLNAGGNVIATAPVSVVTNTATLAAASGSSSNFGAVSLGSSVSKSFTLTNTGGAALSGVSPSVLNSSAATVTSTTCGASLAVGANCTIVVTYSPTVLETLNATLKVVSSASNSPATLSLSGSGAVPPDPSLFNVALLMHMEGSAGSATFIDSSPNAFTLTPYSGNPPKLATTSAKFGGTGGQFPGSASWVTLPTTTKLVLSGDFTIEGWIKINGSALVLLGSDYPTRNHQIQVQSSSFGIYNGTAWIWAPATVPLNTWTYLAISRQGSQMTFFVNGVVTRTVTNTNTFNFSAGALGALRGYSLQTWNGSIDEFRITQGVGRYSASFTPSTLPFPDQ